jgi:hypothetical protein
VIDPDARWLAAAACLAERARPLSRPNPAVGAILVKDGVVVGRGWTGAGGRPGPRFTSRWSPARTRASAVRPVPIWQLPPV